MNEKNIAYKAMLKQICKKKIIYVPLFNFERAHNNVRLKIPFLTKVNYNKKYQGPYTAFDNVHNLKKWCLKVFNGILSRGDGDVINIIMIQLIVFKIEYQSSKDQSLWYMNTNNEKVAMVCKIPHGVVYCDSLKLIEDITYKVEKDLFINYI